MNYNAIRVSALLLTALTANAADFAVASIRPNATGNLKGEGSENEKISFTPTSLTMWNVTLRSCLRWAYGMRDYQITGPGWLDGNHFNITAKTSEDSTVEDLRIALQNLLRDRFQMQVRYEAKEMPVYAMSVRRPGKLKPATGGEPSMLPAGGAIEFHNYSMGELAERLASRPFKLDRRVVDRTGLDGLFDFKVELSNDLTGLKHALEGIELEVSGAPSMMSVLQEQLGVVFKPQKAAIDSLIVDRAEKMRTGN
jgi:uncharacterized protein (TIGR03435 family)